MIWLALPLAIVLVIAIANNAMLRADRDLWKRIAAREQQAAGANARDALRWRLHLKDCARGGKTASARHQFKVHATTERLRAGQ